MEPINTIKQFFGILVLNLSNNNTNESIGIVEAYHISNVKPIVNVKGGQE
jgi:hypothetical protein